MAYFRNNESLPEQQYPEEKQTEYDDGFDELAEEEEEIPELPDEEKAEQASLRRDYIDSVKNNLKAQLDNIEIQEKDGTVTKLKKKK